MLKIMKSFFPQNWKPFVYKKVTDDYSILAEKRLDLSDLTIGKPRIGKSVIPSEVGHPIKMATIGEMLKFWPNFDQALYNDIIKNYDLNHVNHKEEEQV